MQQCGTATGTWCGRRKYLSLNYSRDSGVYTLVIVWCYYYYYWGP